VPCGLKRTHLVYLESVSPFAGPLPFLPCLAQIPHTSTQE
jgi:hypothetical protein